MSEFYFKGSQGYAAVFSSFELMVLQCNEDISDCKSEEDIQALKDDT